MIKGPSLEVGEQLTHASATVFWNEWKSLSIRPEHLNDVNAAANFILNHEARYQTVTNATGIPFYVVGLCHYRESSFNFNTHLANGDPLFDRHGNPIVTTHVPAGLGPFRTWEEGAIGAFKHEGWLHGYHWDLLNAMENLEAFNGEGYRHMGVINPYLFSFSNLYVKGKYGSDGHYDPNLVDEQAGVVTIMLALKARGIGLNEVAPAV